jgi:hypothetical protein
VYLWLVTLHLVGVVLFALTHGVSMFVVFRIPHERNRDVIAALLALSSRANQTMYLGLLLLAIGGFGAAWLNAWLLQPWIIASYVVLIGTMIAMYAIGAGFYYPLRDELVGTEKVARLDDEALFAKLAASRRPHVLAAVGLGALVILVGLMVLKPGLA